MKRRFKLVIGLALLGPVLAAAALLFLVDANQFREPVQARLQRTLGRSVTLGTMRLKLFPLSIAVADVTVGESPGFQSSRPFASAKEVNVSADLMSLLTGRLSVRSIRLVEPAIEVIRNEQGVWNVSSLVRGDGSGSDSSMSIDQLEIVDGTVGVTDLAARKPRVAYRPIGLRLQDFGSGRRVNADVTARLPGGGDETIHIQVSGSDARDLAGRVSLKNVGVSGLQRFLGSEASGLDGTLSGETDLRSEKGVLVAAGRLELDDPRVRGSALGFDIGADYQVSYDAARELLDIRSIHARLGAAPLAVAGQVDLKETARQALLRLTVRNGSLAEFARLAGVPAELKGKSSLDLTLRAPLDRPSHANLQFQLAVDEVNVTQPAGSSSTAGGGNQASGIENLSGSGKLTAGTIRYGSLVLTQLQADCAIEHGIIRLSPISANLYGGRQSGAIIVDARRAHPAFTVQSRLEQVDANQLLSATTSLKQTLFGLLATNADLQFAARPGEDIARTLNGSMNLKLHQGKLAGINLMNEAASVARFLGFRKSGEVATNVVDVAGDLKIVNGLARTDNVRMTLEDGSALVSGMMNLADQSLDLKVLMTLHKGLSAQVGGAKIGGFMSTAFATDQGELVIPIAVAGTFAKPRVTPDAGRMAQMKLRTLAPGAPARITEQVDGLVDLFRRRKKP
jgi:AsmA protein